MDTDTDPDGLVQEVTDKDRRIGMTFSAAVSVFGNISHVSDRTGQLVNGKNKSHI